MAKVNQQTLREVNTKAIFTYIASLETVTKRDICNGLQLSFATVSKIVDSLVDDGFVCLQEIGASSGGRKPNIYRFEPASRAIIAIDFSPDNSAHIYLLDLRNQLLSESAVVLANDESIDSILPKLKTEIEATCNNKGIPFAHILGVGVALPGLYHSEKDLVINSLKPSFMDVHITKLLKAALQKPIIVENDANMAAHGYHAAHGFVDRNLLLLNFTDGIGLGLILNANAFYGAHGFAGEVGNIILGHASREQLFRFEDVGTLFEIVRLCKQQGLIDRNLSLDESVEVIKERGETDAKVQQIFSDIGEIIGTALGTLADLFNPDKIILSGNIIVFQEFLAPHINKKVKDISFVACQAELTIESTPDLSKYVAIGCGVKVMQSWLKHWTP